MEKQHKIGQGFSQLALAGVRRLTPENSVIFQGKLSHIHCVVDDKDLYTGIFAMRLFPIHYPQHFISLCHTDDDDKEKEIGVIEDLAIFPEEAQALVNASLRDQYYEQIITRILNIECEHGLLFFDVETQRGKESFIMPWRGDRAEDYGRKGKVLLDALDNRYVIPDVDGLPAKDLRKFLSYIYW